MVNAAVPGKVLAKVPAAQTIVLLAARSALPLSMPPARNQSPMATCAGASICSVPRLRISTAPGAKGTLSINTDAELLTISLPGPLTELDVLRLRIELALWKSSRASVPMT